MVEVTPAGLKTQPFSLVAFVVSTWADGTMASGTGALVGRNDVLTATHVLYDPDHGGWATDVQLYLGADYNHVTNRFDAEGVEPAFTRWSSWGWPTQVFSVGSNNTLSMAEAQYDVALLGLNVAVGDQLGWLGLDPNRNTPQQALAVGYPAGSTGMMQETVQVFKADGVYESTQPSMGPGSSGGPLLSGGYVIGVKNTADWWVDIGNPSLYNSLLGAMAENDRLLPTTTSAGVASGGAGAASAVLAALPVGTATGGTAFHAPDSLYHFFLVAFDAAPGAVYMAQLAQAYTSGMTVRQIVDVFVTKPQFTNVYPKWLTHAQLATKLVATVVQDTATNAAKAAAVQDIAQALDVGWQQGQVLYQVFGNLAAKPLTDPVWGRTAHMFQNETVVARYLTEVLQTTSSDLALLSKALSAVGPDSDVSTPMAILELVGIGLAL